MLHLFPVPAFRDNYIWTVHDGVHAVVVDPGEAAPVLAFLDGQGLELCAVLATHHHADHVGGIADLLRRRQVPVYGPAESIDTLTCRVREGDRVALPELGITLDVLEIPGHTAGHIAYHGNGWLFCGDTLFAAGCGRVFEGTPQMMVASLDKLAALPDATRICCGHEYTLANLRFARAVEPDNADIARREEVESAKRARGEPTLPAIMRDERATNPFLRCNIDAVIGAARSQGAAGPDRVAVFAALREWKNRF